MNKKAFIGATLITATTVGVLVYYRHKLLEQAGKLIDNAGTKVTDVHQEAARFVEILRQDHPRKERNVDNDG